MAPFNSYPPYPASPDPGYAASQRDRAKVITRLIVGVLTAMVVAASAMFWFLFVHEPARTVTGIQVGGIICPSESDVSNLFGARVELDMTGSLECLYQDPTRSGIAIRVRAVTDLNKEEEFASFEKSAEDQSADMNPIDVGDQGYVFDIDTASFAIASRPCGAVRADINVTAGRVERSRASEVVQLLEDVLDLNEGDLLDSHTCE